MIALIQRVDEARVYIDENLKDGIGKGLLVFLGIASGDEFRDADYLLEKITNLRIFEDEQGKMNRSVADISGELLVVSQFTLLADCRKGRRPSFGRAEQPERAKKLYEYFLENAKRSLRRVGSGEFQAMMKIHLVNDGPVTISINSRDKTGENS
ncbi:MAG TPA: D-aminoacyl-tRNA deacylase [Syntrophales bacterium]|nr:D-aminoacyl-tRNA deacylase [Syntrophales bacterium]HPX56136.1 D-aminoacyl-tRNA deacylase [Syntrophales bacterium]